MKKLFLYSFTILLLVSNCKKDEKSSIESEKLPFHNEYINVEAVPGVLPADISDIHFFNEKNGLAISHFGKIYNTTNGGLNWNEKYSYSEKDMNLYQILFTSQSTGYVVGSSDKCDTSGKILAQAIVLKTEDSGESWKLIFQKADMGFHSIAVNKTGSLYVTLSGYRLFKSDDEGKNWKIADSSQTNYHKIWFKANFGYCTVDDMEGKIYQSNNDGISWTRNANSPRSVRDINFFQNTDFLAAENKIYVTNDFGNNWNSLSNTRYQPRILHPLSENSVLYFGAGDYSGGCFGQDYATLGIFGKTDKKYFEVQFSEIFYFRAKSFYSLTEGYALAGGFKLVKIKVNNSSIN